jgi:hypothetical protein
VDERTSAQTRILELVREGMTVVDADGREVGEVAYVQMGDPEAVTTRGNPPSVTSLAEHVSVDGAEPDVPEPLRSRLLRHGFVKVDGPDLFDTDRYVRADRIAGIDGGTVRLAVRREALAEEA